MRKQVTTFPASLLFVSAVSTAAVMPALESPVTRAETIFVAEISDAKPPECGFRSPRGLPPACVIPVHARITRILKDPDHALAHDSFAANLKQIPNLGLDQPWSTWDGQQIGPGQQYLLFSRRDGSLPDFLESPSYVELLTGASDSVADVELVLGVASLPLSGQVPPLAEAVSGDGIRHGPLLAWHLNRMLELGSETETSALSRALLNGPADAFSDDGHRNILGWMYDLAPRAPDRLLHLFVALTLKYFPAGGEGFDPGKPLAKPCALIALPMGEGCGSPMPGTFSAGFHPAADWSGLTKTQRATLDWYLPWIRGNERAARMLPLAVEPGAAGQLRRVAAAIAGDGGQSESRRAEAARLLALAR
jgi:hypothetical protein